MSHHGTPRTTRRARRARRARAMARRGGDVVRRGRLDEPRADGAAGDVGVLRRRRGKDRVRSARAERVRRPRAVGRARRSVGRRARVDGVRRDAGGGGRDGVRGRGVRWERSREVRRGEAVFGAGTTVLARKVHDADRWNRE